MSVPVLPGFASQINCRLNAILVTVASSITTSPMSASGVVFNIQRFSIHDGPGIRTTVFLKGCPLSCFWCHNPEGRKPRTEIMYHADRCIHCGECVDACPNRAHALEHGAHVFDRDACRTAGACVKVCCSEALEMIGSEMTVDQVVTEVLRDKPFYETSRGGVTLSGGEPTLQSEFCRGILTRLKSLGVHTAIETCGNCHWRDLESLLPVTDLVMLDLKSLDSDAHKNATGAGNSRVLDNARSLARTEIPLLLRTPVVPGVNDDTDSLGLISTFVLSLLKIRAEQCNGTGAAIRYELLTFHKLASDKYRSLGMDYAASELETLGRERMDELANFIEARGLEVTVR